jgi:hypothetical protein
MFFTGHEALPAIEGFSRVSGGLLRRPLLSDDAFTVTVTVTFCYCFKVWPATGLPLFLSSPLPVFLPVFLSVRACFP